MDKRFSLFLVNPAIRYKHYSARMELCTIMGKKTPIPPLALPTIAALTPGRYSIRIIDEEVEKISFKTIPDLVGITSTAASIERAYEIADRYREAGAKVVMGGIQASAMPDEALQHADSVVVGEAEEVWSALLDDFENGSLKRIYRAENFTPFKRMPLPRWDLYKTNEIMMINVQVSRGCPFHCEFCCVPEFYGRRMRYRDIDNVIDEITALPSKRFFFIDDNLTFNKQYARELMQRLKPLRTSWVCQSSIEIARDDELLRAMADAGCMSILIGFESLKRKSLDEIGKKQNKTDEYEEAIRKIHSFGIHVFASFMIGFDPDTPEDLDDIYAFIVRNRLPFSAISILAAAPGSALYRRMEKEGRLLPISREYINGIFPTIRYRHFSSTDMIDRYYATAEKVYSIENIRLFALDLLGSGAFNKVIDDDVTFFEKAKVFILLLRTFAFSADPVRRKLFQELLALEKKGIVGMNEIVIFLLSMEGFRRFFIQFKKKLPAIRAEFARIDSGY